jgi:hypothetical protein
MLPKMQRLMEPTLLSAYAITAAAAWLYGGIALLLAWLSSALASMYLTEKLRTFCAVSHLDSFWRPVIGVTWFWLGTVFIFFCTPSLFSYLTWERILLACACMSPLVAAWYMRAMSKPQIAYACIGLHLLTLLGATKILDNL